MTKNLGKGLAELFRDTGNPEIPKEGVSVVMVGIEFLSPSEFQPRKKFSDESLESLSESIKERGILQPILARKINSSELYQIIAGERRWRAAKKAGLTEVPVILNDFSDAEVLESALLENIQREDLNPIEEAEGYEKLITKFGYTQEQISKFSGKSRSHVANILRLLALPAPIKALLIDYKLSFGHARALVGNPEAENIAKKIIYEGLNVRQTEQLVRLNERSNKAGDRGKYSDPEIQELQSRLKRILNTEVKINLLSAKGEGTVTIRFDSLALLDDIIYRLSK